MTFVPYNITTEAILVSWLRTTFPNLNDNEVASVLAAYPNTNIAAVGDVKYATSGNSGANALTVSPASTGQQQRANVR